MVTSRSARCAIVVTLGLFVGCRQIVGIEDKPECIVDGDCAPADVCDKACIDARCRTPVGRACGPSGGGKCNEGHACIGPGTKLAAKNQHTCARFDDGKVFCWGENLEGEIGDGTRDDRFHPTRVIGIPPAKDVAAGYAHSCAIDVEGGVWCWGDNEGAQIGSGERTELVVVPRKVPGLSGATSLALGYGYSCALLESGQVRCWGENDLGQCGVGRNDALIRAPGDPVPGIDALVLSGGRDHACVLQRDASVWCWGADVDGQVGPSGAVGRAQRLPVRVPLDGSFIALGLSFASSCATRTDGAVFCWGKNDRAMLGDGTEIGRAKPERVVRRTRDGGTELLTLSQELLTTDASVGCSTNGNTGAHECWGWSWPGQLGVDLPTEQISDGNLEHRALVAETIVLPGITKLTLGDQHGCGILSGEIPSIVCFGKLADLGIGDPPDGGFENRVTKPTPVAWAP